MVGEGDDEMNRAASDGPRAWMTFLAVRGCLIGVALLLEVVWMLRRVGLVGPAGIGLALRWSNKLVHKGMELWRAR